MSRNGKKITNGKNPNPLSFNFELLNTSYNVRSVHLLDGSAEWLHPNTKKNMPDILRCGTGCPWNIHKLK